MRKTIKHAAQLVTVSHPDIVHTNPVNALGIIEDGAIMIEGNLITWIGKTSDLPSATRSDVIIDASNKVVMPGFIDPHTHLVFAGSREMEFEARLRGTTYKDTAIMGGGIMQTVAATRQASHQELYNLAYKRLDRMLRRGTTTVEAKTGYGLTIDDEIKLLQTMRDLNEHHPIDIVPTFMALDIPPEFKQKKQDFTRLITEEMIPRIAEEKLAKFCDVFCDHDVFSQQETRQILEAGKQYGLLPRMHADSFDPFKAAEFAAEFGVIAADYLLLVSDKGIEMLAEKGVIADLLPGVPFFTAFVRYAPARKMLETGVKVALATGCNPGACMTESLPLIMTIACTQMRMSPAEAIVGVTAQAARSLCLFEKIGSLEVGKQADIVILDIPNYQYLTYHFGVNHVSRVIKNGKIVLERQTS
ncbi:imidazolonepropionase [Candidatus Moduliflexus flocculans]|uniref:Imidazolonepropionase n=1 Tax=Candidatus Moduliflexus flocculans TaxID=1499966 RepID=A0A081BQ66_9BACT|nr:imidazolonepropionase [Candidatus Moduliflexus flocculans]